MQRRITRLQTALLEEKIDLYLDSDPVHISYLTGAEVSTGLLVISKRKAELFVDSRYFDALSHLSTIEVKLESGRKEWAASYQKGGLQRVAVPGGRMTYQEVMQYNTLLGKGVDVIHSEIVETLRTEKDEEELAMLSKSAELLWKGFLHLYDTLKAGVTEKQLAWEFEQFIRNQGGDGLSFSPIVAFGKNGAYPHYHPQDVAWKEGAPALIDIGVMYKGYASDMTRVISKPHLPPQIKELYTHTKAAYMAAKAAAKAGVEVGQLDAIARNELKKAGLEAYFTHSLGHGIGREVHEQPFLRSRGSTVLAKNMVCTIEPGVYIPQVGGVRYENMVVITEGAAKTLLPEEF